MRKIHRIGRIICILGLLVFLYHGIFLYISQASHEFLVFVPSVANIIDAMVSLARDQEFWIATIYSHYRVFSACIMALIVGIPLGFFLGSHTRANSILGPLCHFARYLPIAALVPLSILLLGVDDSQKIIVLFFGVVFHISLSTQQALQSIPHSTYVAANSLGLSRYDMRTKIILPATGPALFDIARFALAWTRSYLLVAEVVAASDGLGYLIMRYQRFLQVAKLYSVILFLGCIGLVYDQIFHRSKPKLFPRFFLFSDQGDNADHR